MKEHLQRRIDDRHPGQPLQWDDKPDVAALRAGAEQLKAEIERAEGMRLTMLALPVEIAKAASAYVEHLAAQPVAAAAEVPNHKIYAVIDSMGWALDDQEKDDMYRLCKAMLDAAPADKPSEAVPRIGNEQIDSFLGEYEIRADEGVYTLTAHDRWVIANFLIELDEEFPLFGLLFKPSAQVTASDAVQYLQNVAADVLLALRNTDREPLATLLEGAVKGIADSQSPAPVTATDLHGKIMNIRRERDEASFPNVTAHSYYMEGHREARHAAAEMVSAAATEGAPVTAEPVAYMYQDDADKAEPGTGSCVVTKSRNRFYRNETPLFAAPVSPQPAAQVPSIDTPEFRQRLAELLDAAEAGEKGNDPMLYKPARDRFVAHIDTHIARSLPATTVDRDSVLEEAAEICENEISQCCYTAEHCAETIRALKGQPAASLPATSNEAPAWISVDERLPEKECLAVYVTPHGKQRLIRAKYARQFQIEAEGDDRETEYNEADDTFYIKAGWLECIDNWGEYSSYYVTEGTVTHWMSLPAAPSSSAATAGGAKP